MVRIVVTADNEASAVSGEVAADFDAMADQVVAASEAYTAAMEEAAAAQAALTEAQSDSDAAGTAVAQAQARVTETATAAADAQERLAEAQAQAAAAGEGDAESATAVAEAQAAAEATASELAAAQAQLDGAQTAAASSADAEAAAQDRVSAASLASLDAQIRLTEADMQLAAAATEAGDASEAAGAKAATAAEETGASAGSMAGAFGKLKLAALGIGAAIVYGTVKAAGFQSQLETLHTQAGVAQNQLASLGNGVLSLAGQVGADPDSLVQALYHVESSFASVGITGPKALSLLKIAAEGAAVGHANLTDVTNALDATIVAGVPGINSYSQAMGTLNAIVGSGDMTMQDLANAMGTGVMAVAKSFGQSIYQVGAALALFGDNNIRGAKAATELRMAWQAMQAPLATAKPVLQSIGLSMTQLGSTMEKHGMSAAIEEFIAHLQAAKVPAADWGQYMTEIFGKKAGVGIGIMVDQIGRLNSKFPDLEKGAAGFGNAWKAQQQTVSQQWKDLTAGMSALATKMGEIFLPAAMKIVHALTEITGWLTRNKAAAYALAAVIAGTLSVVIGGKFINAIKDGADAFKMLGESEMLSGAAAKVAAAGQWLLDAAMDANPIVLIIAALVLLGIAFYELWKHCKAFRDFWKDLWKDVSKPVERAFDDIKKIFSRAWGDLQRDIVEPVVHAFDDLKNTITGGFDKWWKQNGQEVKQVWTALWGAMTAYFRVVWDVLSAIVRTQWKVITSVFKAAWDVISTTTRVAWDVIMAILRPGLDLLTAGFRVAFAIITGIFKAGWDIMAAIVKIAWAAIQMVVKTAWDIVVGIFTVGLDIITGHWGKAWHDVTTTVTQVWNNITAFFKSTFSTVEGLVTQLLNDIKGAFDSAWNAIKSGVRSAFSDILGLFGGLPGRILGELASLPGQMFSWGAHVIDMVADGIKSAIGAVTSAIGSVAGAIADVIPHSPARKGPLSGSGSPDRAGARIAQMLAQGMTSGLPAVSAAANRMAGAAGISPGGGHGYSAAAAGGTGSITLEVTGGGSGAFEQFMLTAIRNWVRVYGGGGPDSVQRAFGRPA